MPVIEGARYRLGADAGDVTGYFEVYTGTANAGTPGTAFGAGTVEAGGLVASQAAKKLFINTGSKATPTWTVVGSQT